MTSHEQQQALLPDLAAIAVEAGRRILEVYRSGEFNTTQKGDNSPLTRADTAAHQLISARLQQILPRVPLLSEEGDHTPYSERSRWDELFLVDPLDGTREFVNRTDDFTVNIALIQHSEPVTGVIYAPVTGELWAGIAASRQTDDPHGTNKALKAQVSPDSDQWLENPLDHAIPISVRTGPPSKGAKPVVMVSRSHLNAPTREYLDHLESVYGGIEAVNVGSSLKLCRVAEGSVDLYPRHAPTSEWDIAAGHALVRAAGGEIYQVSENGQPTGQPLQYNKEDLLNPWFLVRAW